MDLEDLRAFSAVARLGSFSAAAGELFITQPAVSKRVRALEDELGVALFDRLGRRVLLTEAGRALLPRARHILQEVEDSRRAVSNLAGRIEGPLSLGTSHHIGLHRLPPVLRRYRAAHPQVRLDLRFMDSEAACAAVRQGDLELALVTLPPDPPPELEQRLVWPDPLAVVAAPDHPLCAAGRLTPQALARHEAVLPGPGTFTRGLVEAALARHGLAVRVALTTNYLETLKMLASVGLGWSVLPHTLAGDGVVVLEVEGLAMARRLGAVWHGARTLSNAARAMLELLPAAG